MKSIFFIALLVGGALASPLSFLGPRAGVGLYFEEQKDFSSRMHSLFGWSLDIPYQSENNGFTGYAEGGFFLAAVEQGVFRPEAWGYFGMRGKHFGMGAGPYVSSEGIGLGLAPYIQLSSGKLRIPIALSVVVVKNGGKMTFTTGFSFKD